MIKLVNELLYNLFCVLFELFGAMIFGEDKCIAEDRVPPAPIKTEEDFQYELFEYIRENHDIEEFRKTLYKVTDVNFFRENKRTPLMMAVKQNKYEFVEELLKRNDTCVNAQDSIGFTALHYAVSANNLAIVELLLDDLWIGRSLELKTIGEKDFTPLQLAETMTIKREPDPWDKHLISEKEMNGKIITVLKEYVEIAANPKKREMELATR